jgi:hypothetical protein
MRLTAQWKFIVIPQLQPFFRTLTAFILFGLLEEALPAQYALAFPPKSAIVTFSAF